MEKKSDKLPFLTLSGMGKGAGGHYDRIRLDGMCSIGGDVICNEYNGNGKSAVNGRLTAGTAEMHGTTTVEGTLEGGLIRIHGLIKCLSGVNVEELTVDGSMKASGDVQAERLTVRGQLKTEGTINAGTVTIDQYGGCRAKEIGGDTIRVSKKFQPFNKLLAAVFPAFRLQTDTIEGDEIYLEYTDARVVRGNRVEIGPGCRIGLVEYSGSYRAFGNPEVKEHRQM